jgi:uncharacterized membrane-anchored protein YitT (DUF2179 family)
VSSVFTYIVLLFFFLTFLGSLSGRKEVGFWSFFWFVFLGFFCISIYSFYMAVDVSHVFFLKAFSRPASLAAVYYGVVSGLSVSMVFRFIFR